MRWKRCCRKDNVTRVAAQLQQKGQEALPGPLSVSTKYRYFQVFYKWAMLDSNQRPPPCKGEVIVSQTFAVVQISLQMSVFALLIVHLRPQLFAWVGVLIGVQNP